MIQTKPPIAPAPEIWGGIECSHVRVRNDVRDQLTLSGHTHRLDDLDRIAALGLKALRYPILWEHHASAGGIDWGWADERLGRLRELGIRPIVGFLHHGSGPLPGGLLDPGFAEGLARFARTVAERFPWIEAYTPVNEPNTTARFSGLYGLWHPHGHDVKCYGQCFINQCLATRAAMKAIREINPRAELIQTEDVGKVHSTPRLAYQAAYENERRWLTFDVLCGRIDRSHLVRPHLLDCGVSELDLESFVTDPCPPDVLGMNHYVTSERFLDERRERYPLRTHGGNGRERYADVDAVRVRAEGLVGTEGLMHELWRRYRRPLAVTEVQLACTREEQVRWLLEAWHAARHARAAGVDVRAITPWSLLGAYDWDSLLVHACRHYEAGAFDVRGPEPRCTLVGTAIGHLVRGENFAHPALGAPGWWRRPVRLEYPSVPSPDTGPGTALAIEPPPLPEARPIVVLGARGTLGQAFLRLCELRGLPAVGLQRSDVDLADLPALRHTLAEMRPWAAVNCVGFVRVDDAERETARCGLENTVAATNLALTAAEFGVRMMTFSSDLVFDGTKSEPYMESDAPNPLNVYGRSKYAAETQVLLANPAALIVRTSAFFGPWDEHNFAAVTTRALTAGRPVRAARDYFVSPTYVPDLVNTALDLLLDGETGLWHLANVGRVSWLDWARRLAEANGFSPEMVRPAEPHELGWTALRPRSSVLGSERGLLLPPWERALERYLAETRAPRPSLAA